MKTCDKCKYAEWERTKVGRLHPNRRGMCTFKIKVPELPNAFFWVSDSHLFPAGGPIKRGRVYEKHCPYAAPVKD